MPASDQDLLARLNALKPSSVNLQQPVPTIEVETTKPQSVEDRLAERLKSLRAGGDSPKPSGVLDTGDAATNLTAQVKDEVVAEKDPIRDWQQQDGDDQTLDELLAELGSGEEWKLNHDDPLSIESLVKEARDALPQEPETEPTSEGPRTSTGGPHTSGAVAEQSEGQHDAEDQKAEDQQDEEDADDYVKRVLAELEVEKKYGGGEDDADQAETADNGLGLPSTPSNLKEKSQASEPQPPSYEDSELEARFSKLGLDGLNLPSTPTASPSAKPKVTAQLKPKSNLPTYTDDDIDSWCCICNEDATVKCLGCDGDLYCQECWTEGHGAGPGQERGHRAVQYNRKGPAPAAA